MAGGKLAEAYVEISTQDAKLDKGISTAKSKIMALAGWRIPGGGLGGIAALFGGAALTSGIGRAIEGASSLGETVSKVETVFGKASDRVKGFTDEMAEAFGTPKREMLDAQAMFGLIAQGMNKTKDESADLANSFSKLAADAASFHNTDLPTALEKIRAGLTGESEPLKAWGILIDEDRVKAEALALGLAKNAKEIDNNAKFMARASLITKGLAAANGDLERTQGSASNQAKKFHGQMQNLSDTIGTALLPSANKLLVLFNTLATDAQGSAGKSASSWGGFFATFNSGVEMAGIIYENWSDIIERTGVMVGGSLQNVGERIEHLRATSAAFLDWFAQNWAAIINDTVLAGTKSLLNLIDMMSNPQKAVGRFISGELSGEGGMKNVMLGGFKEAADPKAPAFKAPKLELSTVDDQLAAIDKRMAERAQGKLDQAAKGAQVAKQAGAGDGKTAGEGGATVKSLITDADSYDRELREAGLNAKEDKDEQKKIADEAVSQTKLLEDIRDELRNGGNGQMMLGRWGGGAMGAR